MAMPNVRAGFAKNRRVARVADALIVLRRAEWTGLSGLDRWRSWAVFAMERGDKVGNITHQRVKAAPVKQLQEDGHDGLARWSRRVRAWLPEPIKAMARSVLR